MRIPTGTAVFLLLTGAMALAQPKSGLQRAFRCDDANSGLCTERYLNQNYEGEYVGHDEPSVLFYSNVPGSGNTSVWRITLPKDSPVPPNQAGTGGTWNFQLHPAFWFGTAMCDSQSFPEFTKVCKPATDANIFDNANPTAPDYIGHHPGTAFMEMQFYPPGWVTGADATRYAAAITIDSFLFNPATGSANNTACRSTVGDEPLNFAFIQKNGKPTGPPDPLNQNAATFTPNAQTLLMKPGDTLIVALSDSPNGLRVTIRDLTSRESGFMVASKRNGFAQVVFDPSATACSVSPYDFHTMYSTSSEHTRVPWAAHSYNIAFSDEIGHFEFCNAVDPTTGNCIVPGVTEKSLDGDDTVCFTAAESPLIPVTACIGSDFDFDGVPYQHTWPGSLDNVAQDMLMNPGPIRFSSPLFRGEDGLQNYQRVAFEADLPSIETATKPACNRTTGANCVNPPAGSSFYPFFSTWSPQGERSCSWQLGGAHIPGTVNSFGGSSATEFGTTPLALVYPSGNSTFARFEDFRRILNSNPCPAEPDPVSENMLGN